MSDYGLDDICGNCGSRFWAHALRGAWCPTGDGKFSSSVSYELGTSVLAVPNGSDNDAVLPPEDKLRLEHGNEPVDPKAPLENEIRAECQALADFLVEKNRAYGNSASEPCRIFAKRVDPLAQIDCRIDDKLNRLMRGSEYPGDDTVLDLAGYLVMRRIVAAKQKKDGEQ